MAKINFYMDCLRPARSVCPTLNYSFVVQGTYYIIFVFSHCNRRLRTHIKQTSKPISLIKLLERSGGTAFRETFVFVISRKFSSLPDIWASTNEDRVPWLRQNKSQEHGTRYIMASNMSYRQIQIPDTFNSFVPHRTSWPLVGAFINTGLLMDCVHSDKRYTDRRLVGV
jgi:hypothetical protein